MPGVASTFTIYLPQTYMSTSISGATPADTGTLSVGASTVDAAAGYPATSTLPAVRLAGLPSELVAIPDDRDNLHEGDAVLLVIEDDPYYARVLVDLAHDSGFKVIHAMRGLEGLALTRQFHPTAITLDVFLPDMLGWTVLSQLKQDPDTRHIPVQIVTLDEDRQHGLARGAYSFSTKPTTAEGIGSILTRMKTYAATSRKRLLIVEDNAAEQLSITELLWHDDIEIATADTGATALAALHEQAFDCVVLDLRLPDMTGFEVLERIRDDEAVRDVPVVVFTGKELSPEEDAQLHTLARSVVVKGVESPERLLDETALFLHRVVSSLPEEKRQMLDRLHSSDDDLVGKKVLVVDDDVRNIFALSSVLERRGMRVLTADTGREAITMLESTPDMAIVLMDIMMPEMDGYETMQVIRQNPAFRRLPIVALTAKAMKGDREKCLEAGASDYLAKPVNTEQLLTALRLWLHR
jgi:CheY-like chemotaxis protein